MEGKETALHLATKDGDLSEVNELLNSTKADVNAVTEDSEYTALHYAAELEDSQILHLLLMSGAKPNKVNADGQRPLSLTLKAGNVASAVILISFGGRLSTTDLQAADPIHHACQEVPVKRRAQMITILQKRFALVESRSPSMVLKKNLPTEFIRSDGTIDLVSGVDWAIRKGTRHIFNYLLDIKPELIHIPGKKMRRPLHRSVETRQRDLAKVLLEMGSHVNAARDEGSTPLHLAAKCGDEDMLDLLLEYGADKSAKTSSHHTPHRVALRNGHAKVAKKLKTGRYGRATENDISSLKVPLEDVGSDIATEEGESAGQDGVLQGADGRDKKRPQVTIVKLRQIAHGPASFKTDPTSRDGNEGVKIAVLDSGIDMELEALKPNPNKIIAGKKNFIAGIKKEDNENVNDTSGHGTQVAGLVLEFVPHAQLYIAKVCDGEALKGPRNEHNTKFQTKATAKAAILWAIREGVNIINMSLGFKAQRLAVKDALKKAKDHKILVFAAMNNSGNHEDARWPASDKRLAIGIHGSQPDGVEACSYAGMPVEGNPNLMVRGEWIDTHLSGSLTQPASGSSYATPIAASMAAMMMQFAKKRKLKNRKKLTEIDIMFRLLKKVSREARNGFRWIHPRLIWKDLHVEEERDLYSKDAFDHASKIIEEVIGVPEARGNASNVP